MKKILKRGLSLVLALIMVTGLLPVTAFAAVDSSGKPTDLNNTLVLSIYTGSGFPGEPAVYGTSNYQNINSSFAVRSGATFASSAANQLDWEKIKKDLVQGASSGNTSVWGVYDANGTKDYFLPNASIINSANEIKMIQAAKGCTAEEAKNYEIVWYVIKLQHSPGSGWFSRASTEWHIDGVIKEKTKISINYYGNGNTSGNAPLGTTSHTAGDLYTVLDKNTMVKKINGVEVSFLGWSAKADGTGAEAGFYQPGDVISPTESISLYAMWDTFTQYTATVNTYLDGVLTDESDIHGADRELYLSTDEEHYYQLTRDNEGVYTVKITGNGKFHLYHKNADGTYTQIGTHQLTIYNQNGHLDVHHYSVAYDPDGGEFAANPGKQAYLDESAVMSVSTVPTRDGYRFLGWKDSSGKLIQPGEAVTASIDRPITLTAQWEKTVNVTVNVTINHEGGNGYDQMATKDNVSLALVSRENDTRPYLEVEGKTLKLDKGAVPKEQKVTTYTGNTFTDMPGGDVDYTVVTSKSGYDTTVTPKQDADGNWIIDVVMTYNPTNFDLAFTVEVDENVPEQYVPDAAIVKVTFWSTDRNQWEIITQQEGNLPGVRVDIDPDTRSGSGSYPVWKYESAGTNPYGYRVVVTSFVYPDGTIVPVNDKDQVEKWTDDVYTATINDVTGGKAYGDHNGAYYSGNTEKQVGTLKIVIDRNKYNVTFDAQEGKIKNVDTYKEANQYVIPDLESYVPTREGYTFGGWYEDAACTIAATEGKDLKKDITLYAKWIAQLTIQGEVKILGTYKQNGETVEVHDIDRATEAVVVLQEIRDGKFYEVDSQNVTIDYRTDKNGYGTYSFTGILDDGKSYQIHVLELNYSTAYDNESDIDNKFTEKECTAYFGDDTTAVVNAELTFVPPSYDQPLKVDATAISENFRPTSVLSEVMYRDVGDIHPFKRISQHDVEPYGVGITLNKGKGEGEQSVWKWHTDGTLYDYQMNITKLYGNVEGVFSREGTPFDSDNAPFYIEYSEPAHWNEDTEKISGDLVATLIPNEYRIIFELNADTDPVTGMDAYRTTEVDAEGDSQVIYVYDKHHKWSYETAFTVAPQREGYTFKGWETSASGVASDADGNVTIDAAVHQEVTLTAQWEKITYEVTTEVIPNNGGTAEGAGTYDYGAEVTLTATAAPGYTFVGWKENEKLISNDANLTIEKLTENRSFVAEFSQNAYSVVAVADPEAGGTVAVSDNGIFTYGEKATVTATVNDGYTFAGWYNGTEKISNELSFDVEVTENLSYVAEFEAIQYTVTTNVSPAEGGETTGNGTYAYGTEVTVQATAKDGYAFVGWTENGTLVSENTEFTFTVEGDRTLTAEFIRRYTVTVSTTSGGTAAETRTYNTGETATVVATANVGYKFMGWYEDGELVDSNAEYSFVVDRDRKLKASFAEAAYTVTVAADPAEGGTVTGGGAYASQETATVTATANAGYVFIGWYENDKLVKEDASYSWSVYGNRTLTARFVKKSSYRSDYVYLFGYQDTQIGATGPLLRGEVAQMIYRLVRHNGAGRTSGKVFADTSGQWFQSGMAYMAQVGAIDDGQTYGRPYGAVTRGETYKMICLGLKFTDDNSLRLSQYATILRNHGYSAPEGTVTGTILRWQFCDLFNQILGRSGYELKDAAGNEITAETYGYTDLDPNASYYKTMLIATSNFKDGKVDSTERRERNEFDYGN